MHISVDTELTTCPGGPYFLLAVRKLPGEGQVMKGTTDQRAQTSFSIMARNRRRTPLAPPHLRPARQLLSQRCTGGAGGTGTHSGPDAGVLNKPQADYCPLGGRHPSSPILPLLPYALAGETVLGLGLFSLEVRFMGPPLGGGGGVRYLCAQSRASGFQLFTASE